MPQRTSYEPGTPCWVDLMTPDVAASTAFYTALFGWDTETTLDDDGNHVYTRLTKNGLDVGGLGGQPPDMAGAPPIWNSYVCVTDADETAAKIEKTGGRIMMPPMQVFEHGIMAVAADPTGAMFCLWQPLSHQGAGVVNEPDTYSWNELLTSDIEASKAFYADVFGWAYEGMDMGPGGMYWVIQGGDAGGLGGLMARPADLPADVPDSWGVYFTVADVDATVAAVTGAGGALMFGPVDVPEVGRFATVSDPQGGSFSVIQNPA